MSTPNRKYKISFTIKLRSGQLLSVQNRQRMYNPAEQTIQQFQTYFKISEDQTESSQHEDDDHG